MDNGITYGMDIRDLIRLEKFKDILYLMVNKLDQHNSQLLLIIQLLIMLTLQLDHQVLNYSKIIMHSMDN